MMRGLVSFTADLNTALHPGVERGLEEAVDSDLCLGALVGLTGNGRPSVRRRPGVRHSSLHGRGETYR
jgi:hypothetical protein